MPQATITYDTGYNRKLKSLLDEMDAKHWNNGTSQYHPSPMGFKLSNFHGDYAGEPSARMMVGGGSHGNQRLVHSGNSPAYPPYMMSSGMLVNSGGARIGVDGAVGGYSFNNFIGDIAHVGKEVAPDLIREYARSKSKGAGRRKMKGGDVGSDILSGLTTAGKTLLKFAPFLGLGRKGGSAVGDQIADVFKTIAPFAPLLMGLGRPAPKSKKDIVDALSSIGAKANHSLPKLAEVALRGGYDISDFGNDVAGVVKAIIGLGGRSSKKSKVKGGIQLKDVIESAKGISDLVKSADPAITDGVSKLVSKVKSKAPAIIDAVKSAVGAGRGRSARTAIVKKVMKDRGVKMIEASKIVKAEGLY